MVTTDNDMELGERKNLQFGRVKFRRWLGPERLRKVNVNTH